MPAERALAEVTAELANSRFDRLLSQGYAAIADEDYDDAETAFRAALAIQPRSDAARDGLAQAEQGQKLDAIALSEIRALAFERRELWDEAIARYEAALVTDASLQFAIEGIERAQARADLDNKLENLIANPNLLLTDTVLADAEALLAQAQSIPEPGMRIQSQLERLGSFVRAAKTPVPVELHSDAMTQVTVYRIGNLGAFDMRTVELRPGTYTAIGSRDGYRDVRTSFTVLPGRAMAPISIVCVEPI